METIENAQTQVLSLLSSVQGFIEHSAEEATYQAPIIDWHHPDSYRQSGIVGLKKFLSTVETERDYIYSLANSAIPPAEVASNIPHLLALWEQVEKAQWPIVCISQLLECGDQGHIKVDVVAGGGEEWVKVNTMKEARLMAEFREQDSYINSDYESSDDLTSPPGSEAGPSALPKAVLTNSAIEQAAALVRAAEAYPRIPGFPPPRIKYVLNRLEENPTGGYADPRVKETFEAIRALGVDLVLASDVQPVPQHTKRSPLIPTKKILLDLSVVVALCCDSTHQPLPTSPQKLEERFRALRITTEGKVELAPHIPVTKDLRDQLDWEMRHPLVQEMQERLTPLFAGRGPGDVGGGIEFWVTDEVRNRLPAIADIIGGEDEKLRAKAMFDGGDFWAGSRWKGKEGILGEMVVRVLPPDVDGSSRVSEKEKENSSDVRSNTDMEQTPFKRGFVTICRTMLDIVDLQNSASSLPPQPEPDIPTLKPKGAKIPNHQTHHSKIKIKGKSRKSRQPPTGISIASRLPSAHTLRTLIVGFERGWTVLTNNRGAVGKVVREMRIGEGLGYGSSSSARLPPRTNAKSDITREETQNEEDHEAEAEGSGDGEVAIWVVNPSSLAEWRRKEVEAKNREVRAHLADPSKEESYRNWLKEGSNMMGTISLEDDGRSRDENEDCKRSTRRKRGGGAGPGGAKQECGTRTA